MALSDQEVSEIQRKMIQLNRGSFISRAQSRKNATYVYSEIIEDFYWNYACLIDAENTEVFLEEVENFFEERDRDTAIYITPATRPEKLGEEALNEGFSYEARDAWMFYRGEKPDIDTSLNLRMVETSSDVPDFLRVFEKAYGGAEDEEAYGDLPDYYVDAVEKALNSDLDDENVLNIVAYLKYEAVAIGSMAVIDGLALIYNIGVLPGHRGKGFGTTITEFLVSEALELGVERVMLQTEEGSVNEGFFREIGFEKEVSGKIMVK